MSVGCDWQISIHFIVSVFQNLLAVTRIVIDGDQHNCKLGFELQSSYIIERRKNLNILLLLFC